MSLLLTLFIALAGAREAAVQLVDAGREAPEAPVVLIVVTPGVPASAYLAWVSAIEELGLDAWIARAPSRGQSVEEVQEGLAMAFQELASARGEVAVAAHGYGGVLALGAALPASRMALVGVPLAAHPVEVQVMPPEGPVAEALPWPPELLGGLPAEPYSGALGRAYARWAADFPALAPPTCPTLLVASALDPVAPPELVRLPSAGWPDRTWVRRGPLAWEATDPSHAQLLLDPGAAREVARFVAGRPVDAW